MRNNFEIIHIPGDHNCQRPDAKLYPVGTIGQCNECNAKYVVVTDSRRENRYIGNQLCNETIYYRKWLEMDR